MKSDSCAEVVNTAMIEIATGQSSRFQRFGTEVANQGLESALCGQTSPPMNLATARLKIATAQDHQTIRDGASPVSTGKNSL